MNAYSISELNSSIYIPVVGNMTEQDIIYVFWEGFIGSVRRVDFFESANGNRSAFVHFAYWFNNNEVTQMWDTVEQCGSFKYWYSNMEYIIIRKMICKPIADTDMNIHQLAAKLMEQDAKLNQMETKIHEQEDAIVELQKQLAYTETSDQHMLDQDDYMNRMVDSLLGPRWPDEDDSNAAVVYAEVSDDEAAMTVEL